MAKLILTFDDASLRIFQKGKKMKKRFFSLVALGAGLVSGCSSVQSVPVYVEVPQEKELNCSACNDDTKKQKKVVCATKTKVVNYKDKCNCSYSFPVTVREKSNCKGGDAL